MVYCDKWTKLLSAKHAHHDWQKKLARVRWFTFVVLIFERLWPNILSVILLGLIFVSACWFNLFKIISGPIQIFLLLFFVVLGLWCLRGILKFQRPNQIEVDKRIEQASGLSFQPIFAQYDALPPQSADEAYVLWQAHLVRLQQALSKLYSGYPRFDISKYDPYGLSALVVLTFAIAFAYSFSPTAGRISDAFYLGKQGDWSNMRLDAWVTPPDYTGRAPIYLVEKSKKEITNNTFDVPINSVAAIRISSADTRLKLTANWQDPDNKINKSTVDAKQDAKSDFIAYDVTLDQAVTLQLTGPQTDIIWQFNLIADKAPQISWNDEPKRALNGFLDLSYKIDDDYGATKAWASFEIVDDNNSADDASNAQKTKSVRHSLFSAPQVNLTLPQNGQGVANTSQDFSKNPWAGSRVYITLHAQDAAGNIGVSKRKELVLPQRSFGNPLARALIEQRNLLIFDTANKNRVLDMLYAVQIRPQDTIKNVATVIALASVKRRLALARNDADYQSVVDYLWNIADGVEGGSLSAAAQRLKVAQQALRDALRNGASQEEIERLMAELKNAMTAYINELAQSGQKLQQKSGQNGQDLSDADLQKKIKELQDLAKLGNRAGAEQLLSDLEKILDNLQIIQSEAGSGRGGSQQKDQFKEDIQKNIDDLLSLMQKQQELLNDTNKKSDDYKRGEKSTDEFSNDVDDLRKQQQDLQDSLKNLQDKLQKQGIKPSKEFEDGARSMEKAQDGLNNLDGATAAQNQADALDAIRRGGQDMMNEIREALKRQGQGNVSGNQRLDPLGRSSGNEQGKNGDSIIPSESDIERARQILNAIRKRLGNLTPETQRDYLERLLNFD